MSVMAAAAHSTAHLAGIAASAGAAKAVVAARTQMATTLAFHIILACFGVAFPGVVLVAHYRGLRRHDRAALLLARRWSKVMAVLVAVTGTVLSFEMGLLWPGLMGKFGAAFGIPFAVEGVFFFLEAVFTAVYLYGWDRLPRWALLDRGPDRDRGGAGHAVRGVRQLVDEPAGRVHPVPRQDHRS